MTSARLAAANLSFKYDKLALFNGWSAEFRAGEHTAVTGPSGCGKSTLLFLLGLMLKPDGGAIHLDGAPVHALSERSRARIRAHEFGFVFQDAVLDASRTVLDNILEPTLYRGDDRRAATHRAHALMERFGVQIPATARPGQVSGGQAQRIGLCRALLHKPPVLLADEPTGNLDADSAAVVLEGLNAHARAGAAVVVVTHDSAVVSRCDHHVQL